MAPEAALGRTPIWRHLALWIALFVPGTALAGTGYMGVHSALFGGSGGFFELDLGSTLLLAGAYGAAYAVCLALPYVVALRLWVGLARVFGDTDSSRTRIFVGMLVWSLPQAVIFSLASDHELFLLPWLGVALGLWLPRALFPALRPGVFDQ